MSELGVRGQTTKREIFGWAMFDVANSAYTTVVITIVFSAFFVQHLVPQGSEWGNSYWGLAMILSNLTAMLLAPFLGTLCDLTGRKKGFLLGNMMLCAAATAMLFFVGPGAIGWAIALIVVSNTAWMLSEVFCASFLTDLATPDNMGLLSGIGWGVGYLGGLLSLILVLFGVITADADSDLALYIAQNQQAMLVVAGFFVVVSIPTMLWLRDRPVAGTPDTSAKAVWLHTLQRLSHCWQLSQALPVLLRFFGVFTLYSAGMAIVIKFFGIYVDAELTLSAGEKTGVFLALQLSAFVGAVSFGLLETRIGSKATVFLTLVWWSLGVLSIYYLGDLARWLNMEENQLFMVSAVVAGAGLGSTQSASRTLVGLLTPTGYSAMMFGFWGLFARVAAILGSFCFALVADLVSVQQALLVILGFFVAGAVLILLLPINQGREQARQFKEVE
ncbi:MFS transporter [Ferrimonas marina]|uniref:MFS transporter, UMF1 family n=1 Tax=Ferrimonas marina TaxID=299255 RepID=A0A1M5P1K4_9GAMM|nr:MFS transporter [Ferrimonas marina]SHG95714.1 MFS transporter, UMF1 family [Ferrimonas marina]